MEMKAEKEEKEPEREREIGNCGGGRRRYIQQLPPLTSPQPFFISPTEEIPVP
jgi:hypothetical protein